MGAHLLCVVLRREPIAVRDVVILRDSTLVEAISSSSTSFSDHIGGLWSSRQPKRWFSHSATLYLGAEGSGEEEEAVEEAADEDEEEDEGEGTGADGACICFTGRKK
jgi:hypothetical protein